MQRPILALSLAALAAITAGCATSPNTGATQVEPALDTVPPGWAISVPQAQPDFSRPGPLQQYIFKGDSDDRDDRIKALEKRLLEQQAQNSLPTHEPRLPLAGERPARKLGLVVSEELPEPLSRQLQETVGRLAPGYGSVSLPSTELRTQLASYGCASVELCLSKLAVYPGTQTVAVVTPVRAAKNEIVLRVELYDAPHQQRFAGPQARVALLEGRAAPVALQAFAADLLQQAAGIARQTTWSTRAFGEENGQWYIAAGAQSGLQPGDLLEVRGPSRIVRSPTGGIAGSIPGPLKGRLKVVQHLGADNAVAELVEGAAPTPDDHLTLAK